MQWREIRPGACTHGGEGFGVGLLDAQRRPASGRARMPGTSEMPRRSSAAGRGMGARVTATEPASATSRRARLQRAAQVGAPVVAPSRSRALAHRAVEAAHRVKCSRHLRARPHVGVRRAHQRRYGSVTQRRSEIGGPQPWDSRPKFRKVDRRRRGTLVVTGPTDGITEIIDRLCLRDVILASEDPVQARSELTPSSPVVAARVAACELELNKLKQREGVFTRPSVLANAKIMQPADWWDLYAAHLPILKGIAKSVLGQVVCASAAERNWSVYGQIKTKERSQLSHKTGDKLVYCHEALHLQRKLQRAGYKVIIEKWDSDSESDEGSGDEADLAV